MIDPRNPDYTNTPVAGTRPVFAYAPADPSAPPPVTVVTPCFNVKDVFHETARCVFGQSLQQWEWLIINDGSTDPDSIAILDAYRDRDPRIRVIDHPTNRGLSAARNTGFTQARGRYVFMLDGDDLLEPTAIEKCAWYLESHPQAAFVKGMSVGFGSQTYLWTQGFQAGPAFLERNLSTATALVRRDLHQRVGGFDESIRGGMEDWDFWLRCAAHGYWGNTIGEYLDWYRRRAMDARDWDNLKRHDPEAAMRERFQSRYPALYANRANFPVIADPDDLAPASHFTLEAPWDNYLTCPSGRRRLLMILPWLRMGGADRFNIDLTAQLCRRGWEVTIATTLLADHVWLPEFTRYTPDVFCLDRFLRLQDYPRFLLYLLRSRRITHVLISNSQLGYELLPMIRSHYPEAAVVDYNHLEELHWKDGGYPAMSVRWSECIDLHGVASHCLRNWCIERGAKPDKIVVCHINIDPRVWDPARFDRRAERLKLLGRERADQLPIILWAGRMTDQKRPMMLLEILRRLREQGRDFLALLAGDGEDRPLVEACIEKHGLHRWVRLVGSLSIEQMRATLAAADIFLLPSKAEGIAMAIYEAMAMGVVPVSARVGGQSELVTPEVGYLIPPGEEQAEIEAYVDVLARLLDDASSRRRQGAAARERIIAHFHLDLMGQRMHELLLHAEENHTRHPLPQMPPATAAQCAALSIERYRLERLADHLWLLREQQTKAWLTPPPDPGQVTLSHARAELDYIQNSRTWRAVLRVKRSLAYRVWARLAHGRDWRAGLAVSNDPRDQLARIKASRSFRLIQAMKRTRWHRWYARRKYGIQSLNLVDRD